MSEYLIERESNCSSCYKCIRHCPVKSIRMIDNHAESIGEECIVCGACLVECPRNVKMIRDDVPVVKEMLKEEGMVIASVDPAFAANFPDITFYQLSEILKNFGFDYVEEATSGIAAVKEAYDSLLKEEKQDIIIGSTCHAVNLLIRQYYPEAIPYLAPVLSPMEAHSKDLKKRFPGAKTVYIGPCLARKSEASYSDGLVDQVLTFWELTRWMLIEHVEVPEDIGLEEGNPGRTFDISSGLERLMNKSDHYYNYMTVEGIELCRKSIENILSGEVHHCFIDMYSCEGHCLNGPGMIRKYRGKLAGYMKLLNTQGDGRLEIPDLTAGEISKKFRPNKVRSYEPAKEEIEQVLRQMGKFSPRDELNCESCGYATCREKARAVLQGKADISMCIHYLKDKAEAFSSSIIENSPNGIIALDEFFMIRMINRSAAGIFNMDDPEEYIGRQVDVLLDRRIFELARGLERIQNNPAVYLEGYDVYVDMTVSYDTSYNSFICILRNVTDEVKHAVKREEMAMHTIEVTDKVIEKQMITVQRIASLLGETTAETKVALTKLKESMKYE